MKKAKIKGKLKKAKGKRNYAFPVILISVAIVLSSFLFYMITNTPNAYTIHMEMELPKPQGQESPETNIIYPGVISINATYIQNDTILQANVTNIIEVIGNDINGDIIYSLTFSVDFPGWYDGASNWSISIIFNVTISNATVKVNNMEKGELNSYISDVIFGGNEVIISLKYGGGMSVLVTFPIPSKKED